MSKKIPSIREFYRLVVGPHRKLYPFLKPYLPQFIAGLVFGGLFGGVTGLVPLVLNHVSGFVFPQGHNRAAILSGADNSVHADLNTALLFCAVIPVLMIVRSLCDFLNSYLLAWCSLRILTDIRGKLYEHILKQSLDFFNRERAGNLMSRIINDTRQAQVALTSISSDLIKQPLTIVMGFGAMLYLDWKFTIASMVLVPAFLLPLLSFGKRVKKQGKLEEEKVSQLMTLLQESFTGIRVIKAFAQEKYEARNFWAVSEEGFRNSIHVRKVIEMVSPMVEAVAAVGVGCALFYVWYTHLSAGRLMALLGCVFVLYEPAKKLSRIHLVLQQCNVATTNIFEIMQNEPTIQDREGSVAIEQSTGDFRLENVTFSYRPELPPAIRNVNLHIPPGKYYALVGSSGAGKSTMLSLLLRFYEPNSGAILLDGRDIRTITQHSLRSQIGIVTQDTFLFHDSILNNIRYGRLDATEEDIIEAAKQAYAHDFIMQQPNGYGTVIGDKGCLLSGGQQQRVSIARALLKNAPVLLLDEAMSALDSEAEREIQAALERLAQGKTVVAIAHRLSTVLKADQIVVMNHGEISDIGTHRQLLDSSSLYRRLYDLQFNIQQEELAVPAEA
ncbi:MAG: ABC transporter ATP-binding protein, partial [Verrucomicrobia bacterium]|nr:ABC transporter ATP-binding protein [Verrucomicrobiota bacterium]